MCFAKTKKKCLPVKKIKVKVNSFLNVKCPILKYGLRIIELLKLHLRHTLIYGVIVYKPPFVEDICGIQQSDYQSDLGQFNSKNFYCRLYFHVLYLSLLTKLQVNILIKVLFIDLGCSFKILVEIKYLQKVNPEMIKVLHFLKPILFTLNQRKILNKLYSEDIINLNQHLNEFQ